MSSGMLRLYIKRSFTADCYFRNLSCNVNFPLNNADHRAEEKLNNKLREKTPLGKLDELEEGKHPYQEKEPLKPFPNGVNPLTGEKNGPRGPEPTRYGDWERKGRVTDF